MRGEEVVAGFKRFGESRGEKGERRREGISTERSED